MVTVVIGHGLTNEYLNMDNRFQANPLHVGESEIERLVGKGRDWGKGVLPEFLKQVIHNKKRGDNTSLLLIRERNSESLSPENEFIAPLEEILDDAVVVEGTHQHLPFKSFLLSIQQITKVDLLVKSPY